jgi:hypothetical protein
MNPGSAAFSSGDPLGASAEETDRSWRNYIGYWGTFDVDAKAGTVTHTVEGGWFPNWIGQKQVRAYRFSGKRLTLEGDSPAWHATLVWERAN